VTTGQSQNEPRRDAPDDESPLRLAETNEDSTMPVDGATESDESAAEAPPDLDAEETPSPTTSSSSTTSTPAGTTTGGFDTLLGKLVIQAGFVTKDEVDACNTLLEESSTEGGRPTLADVLVSKDYLTRHQLNRLREEFEAKKSGQRIPGYKITKKLGSGAMATVFLARQISLDRLVAIKILPQKFSNNEKFIERFYKEGRAAAQLNHPNIVGAYDVGRAGDHHYFVMEYVEGRTVHDYILKHKRFKEKDAVHIVRQVARALDHAHERGFVHRDIKPKNIMITRRGVAKLADLGLARAMSDSDAAKAEAGRAYGTPYYISPEQIRGEMNIGPPADIYGLGATFFHMVTGRVPFEGKNPSEVMHRHLKSSLRPPDHINPELSAGCAQVIEMMMAKKVGERYRSAKDLLEDLDLVARGEPPHFAHRGLDHETINELITDVVEASPADLPVQNEMKPPSLAESPLLMFLFVALVFSVVVNLVLLVALLVRH
jgi:serine/threonine protein kinase